MNRQITASTKKQYMPKAFLILFLLYCLISIAGKSQNTNIGGEEYRSEYEIEISKDRKSITKRGYLTLDSIIKIVVKESLHIILESPSENLHLNTKRFNREFSICKTIYDYLLKYLSKDTMFISYHYSFAHNENPTITILLNTPPQFRKKN